MGCPHGNHVGFSWAHFDMQNTWAAHMVTIWVLDGLGGFGAMRNIVLYLRYVHEESKFSSCMTIIAKKKNKWAAHMVTICSLDGLKWA